MNSGFLYIDVNFIEIGTSNIPRFAIIDDIISYEDIVKNTKIIILNNLVIQGVVCNSVILHSCKIVSDIDTTIIAIGTVENFTLGVAIYGKNVVVLLLQ